MSILIFKDHPRTIPTYFGLNWLSGVKEEDFQIKFGQN